MTSFYIGLFEIATVSPLFLLFCVFCVSIVAPTFVETNLTRKRLQNPEFLDFVQKKIPAGRLATVDEIAAAAVFLASEEAGMVNCHTLCVDGGWTAW